MPDNDKKPVKKWQVIFLAVIFCGAGYSWVSEKNERRVKAIAAEAQRVEQQERLEQQRMVRQEKARREAEARERDPAYQAEQRRLAREREERDLKINLSALCEVNIKHNLHDPKSAEFGHYDGYVYDLNRQTNRGSVTVRLRAKNQFGGLVIAYYVCNADISDPQKPKLLRPPQQMR